VAGLIVGLGIATMHYLGMTAMVMSDTTTYSMPLFVLSVVIAIAAGTATLWTGTWVRGPRATIGASLVMGLAVSGMHYTGMAALRVHPGGMAGLTGVSAGSFLLPLVLGIVLVTFVLAAMISLSPGEAELREDAEFLTRPDFLPQRES
jgi:NO-binding membrane sensor protein with MHYT domain